MQKSKSAKRITALFSSLLLLMTMLTPFSVLAQQNADGYEEVLRFSAFEKTYLSGQNNNNIYADWTLGDNVPVDVTDGHELKNLRLQMKFTLTKPDNTPELSTTWNKSGWLKLRSVDVVDKEGDPDLKVNGGNNDTNNEHNYGWNVTSQSGSPMRLHTGDNELLIPLINTEGDGYSVTKRGIMDWTQVNRILFVVSGRDMQMGVADHSLTVTYAAIVDIGEQPDPVPSIEMPTLFSNNMMFQQGKDMKVWGTADAGETIEVAFTKQGEAAAMQTKTTTADADGAWSVELDAMTAGYDRYDMTITAKNADSEVTKSKTISNILIGEVWVAAGQSNMQLPISNDLYADEYALAANNDNIRMFIEPTYPFGEKNAQPLEPEDDIPGAYWGTGADDGDVMSVSAVGYHFAVEMQKKLNVPVGILYTPVGGSVIEAWISRDAIENDEEYKAFLKSKNKYCDENNWPAQGNRMSALFNQKIGALTGYNVAGTIWYQGESNADEPDMYGHALTLLRDNWNEVFGFTDGDDMPFIFTTVEPWITHLEDPQYLAYLAEGMYDGWKANEDRHMAMINIYDLPLYFLDRNGNSSDPIHPRDKQPVGQRFATAAYNMVYAATEAEYTAPVFQSMTPGDSDGDGINDYIDVTFDHVGDGLQVISAVYDGDGFGHNLGDGLGVLSETDDVHGFAIAGTGGVYVDAKAKIISQNTVRVWSDGLKNPANVTYNFYTYYTGGTLQNSVGIPAASFRSDRSATASYFNAQDWKYADANVWTCFSKEVNGNTLNWADFLPSWVSGAISGVEADWSYDPQVKAEGRASVKATYTPDATNTVGIGPVMGLQNVTNQFENFDTIAVAVKNGDARQKQLSLLIRSNGKVYQAKVVEDFAATADKTAVVAASSDFTTYTFSLRHLTDENGKELTDTDAILQNVEQLQFTFTDNAAGTVYVDDVRFGFLYDANVDTAALERELNWTLDRSLYTEDSLTSYDATKQAAQAVYDDPVATQSQVNRMAQTLKEARLSLIETNVITTFSAFEKTYATGDNGQQSLYANWTYSDVSPLDLTTYDMSQLRLQIKFTLTKPDDIADTVDLFNHYGFIKLRSTDTPAENNYGWLFTTSDSNAIRLHAGENELSIPLVNQDGDGYTILRTGTMDWSQVNRIMMMVSSDTMKGREGEFSLEITDVKIVDLRVNNVQKAALKTVIDQTVDTTGDADKVAAYTRTKASAQAVYDDEMSSLTAIAQAKANLETAIAVLKGASFTSADKAALKLLVEEKLDESQYTAASWKTYQAALAAAQTIMNNDYASQAEVDDAADTLKQARAGLLEAQPVDTTELEALTSEALDLTPYTDASVKVYQEAVEAGKAVLASEAPSQAQVDNAVKAIREAKDALNEKQTGDPTDIRVTFSKSNNTYQSLLYGSQLYTNWQVGDGLSGSNTTGGGANLSGTAENGANRHLALQATVTFNALRDGVDVDACWKDMGFRLRSSAVNGSNKEADFYTILPADVTSENGTFQVSIPLSAFTTANIDWADVKELNIYCNVLDEYKKENSGENCDAFTMTLSDAKITSTGAVVEPDRTALTNAISTAEAKLVDGKTYTTETLAALNTALNEAKALLTSDDQAAINAAATKLNQAIDALQEASVVVPVDRDELNAAIQAAEAKLADGKVYANADALRDALTAAKGLSETATQEQVDAAADALNDAIDGLEYTLGDVNGDGEVTAADALLALQAATGKVTLSAIENTAADVDTTAGIQANDALMILQAATGKIRLS